MTLINRLNLGIGLSNTMRRDYYRGSQDSLSIKGRTIIIIILIQLLFLFFRCFLNLYHISYNYYNNMF